MKNVRRLVEEFKPEHYQLQLKVDPEALSFEGSVEIEGDCLKNLEILRVHAKNLNITKASVNGSLVKHQLVNEELLLNTGNKITKGRQRIEISFKAKITDAMVGIYPSSFEHDGNKKQIISTQFESHHAREAFPCIDEPSAKATFDLILTSPKSHSQAVLSNTLPISTTQKSGWVETKFATTPIMSTYLLAFALGELKSLEKKTATGIKVRTWATPSNVGNTRYALDTAVRCLEFFNEYFDTPYPLDKCDLVAIPDFAAGAMENWGLITFRESAMLVDKQITSLGSKQWVALVVAHELAHQWFGNLVTMSWWTDLWLNEGFASWVEYLAIDEIHPEWEMWTQFITDDLFRGMSLDSLEESHPIEVHVPNPDEIRNIFDAISYSKGASVIRMLEKYLGKSTFRDGLSHYLSKNQYANATTNDLWAALEEKSDKSVSNFMNKWTTQTGFPVVHADYNGSSELKLSQSRFFLNPKAKQTTDVWPIPIDNVADLKSLNFSEAEKSLKISDFDYPVLNSLTSGFFMTAYDDNWLERLAKKVKSSKLSVDDRIGLLNDAFQLAKSGHRSTASSLKLLDVFDYEQHPAVWDIISGQIAHLRKVMDDESLNTLMEPFLHELSQNESKRLGFDELEDEPHFDKLLRPTVLAMAARGGNDKIKQQAFKLFARAVKPEDLNAEIRGVVLGAIGRRSEQADYDKMLDWFKQAQDAQMKSALAAGLSTFRDERQTEQSISLITSDFVRLQEVIHWVSFVFNNPRSKDKAWQWLREHWGWLDEKFGTDIMTFMYFPKISGAAFSSESFLDEYDSFFGSIKKPGIKRSVAQGRESIVWQSAWRQRDHRLLNEYFNSWKPST